jgi:hypothetical protein
VLKQVIQQTNSHVGLVWSPDSTKIYATGGADDAVYVYSNGGRPASPFAQSAKIALGHPVVSPPYLLGGLGGEVLPNASGLALSADGSTLVVANNYNDDQRCQHGYQCGDLRVGLAAVCFRRAQWHEGRNISVFGGDHRECR